MTLAHGIGLAWGSVMIAGTIMVDTTTANKTHCYGAPDTCFKQCLKWQHANHAPFKKDGDSPCFSMCDQPSMFNGFCWHEWH
jgi:hypothetical protein